MLSDIVSLPQTRCLPIANDQIVQMADLRFLRSLSRAGLILSRVALQCKNDISKKHLSHPDRWGLYCAVDQGPLDHDLLSEVAKSPTEPLGGVLLRAIKPKHIFKMYPNYATNQVGIMLGVQGPMQTFTHFTFGICHALEQAEIDLWTNQIDCAIVCSASSLEDPIVGARLMGEIPTGHIACEGGVGVVLEKSATKTDWQTILAPASNKNFYGIADKLMHWVLHNNKTQGEPHGSRSK